MAPWLGSGHGMDSQIAPIYRKVGGGAAFSIGAWLLWLDGGPAEDVPQPSFTAGQLLITFNSGLVSSNKLNPVNSGDWLKFHDLTGFPCRIFARIATGTAADRFQRQSQSSSTMGASQMMSITVAGTALGTFAAGSFFGGGANLDSLYPAMSVSGSGESFVFTHTVRYTAQAGLSFSGPDVPINEIDKVFVNTQGDGWFMWGYEHQKTTPAAIVQGDWHQSPRVSKPLYGRSSRLFIV